MTSVDAVRPRPENHAGCRHFLTLEARWMDSDAGGHANSVVCCSLFDTLVNRDLIEARALDRHKGAVIGPGVETRCNEFAPPSFRQSIDAGLRIAHGGASSVRCEIGLFAVGEAASAACGHCVHACVEREARRPVPLPQVLRQALQGPM